MILRTTFYAITQAENDVALLQAVEEEGWTYTIIVVNPDRGLAQIEVRDADGLFVGYL